MGRGRAKAKQTKVARRLKYATPQTDLEALQQELAAQQESHEPENSDSHEEEYAEYDEYAYSEDDEATEK